MQAVANRTESVARGEFGASTDCPMPPGRASCSAMKIATNALLFALLLLTPACEMLGGQGGSMPDINGLLAGITDQQTAEESKPALDGAVAQLKLALQGNADAGKQAADEAAEQGGGMVNTVLAQFGIDAQTAGMITGLLENEAVQGVLGKTLEELKGLLPSM